MLVDQPPAANSSDVGKLLMATAWRCSHLIERVHVQREALPDEVRWRVAHLLNEALDAS
jgi:hypothetical protein